MGMLKEFKEFAMKGNLVDIAVAFVMGATFSNLVTSFVDGMIMPLVGMLTGGIDFSQKTIVLQAPVDAVKDGGGKLIAPAIAEVSIKYGAFLSSVIDFVIVAFVVFIIIKAMNSSKKKVEEAPAAPSSTDQLLIEIRDSLRK